MQRSSALTGPLAAVSAMDRLEALLVMRLLAQHFFGRADRL
jgi:hypothetical protein